MAKVGAITINPPLLNSSSPFASTKEDLVALYLCPFTGAVTTRTSLLDGFDQNDNIHQHVFFGENNNSSINSYGYSPYPLNHYINWIKEIHEEHPTSSKPFIISITGKADELELCFQKIQDFRQEMKFPNEYGFDIAVEINLSCPNVPKVPPPAYNTESLLPYLIVTKRYYLEDPTLIIGLKLPPYTYELQFTALISATWRHRNDQGIAFLASTNTLGSGLVFNDQVKSKDSDDMALPTGWGGLGGVTIHPLSVGNVSKLVSLLESPTQATRLKLAGADKSTEEGPEKIVVFGVGGINSGKSFKHFLNVGAVAGEVGTALGVEGVGVFERICKEAGITIEES